MYRQIPVVRYQQLSYHLCGEQKEQRYKKKDSILIRILRVVYYRRRCAFPPIMCHQRDLWADGGEGRQARMLPCGRSWVQHETEGWHETDQEKRER